MNYEDFPIFQGLSQTQMENFVHVCEQVTIPAGQRILQQNIRGNKIFFLLEGEVRVFIDTSTGEKELSRIAAPTVLGEISFFSGEPNSASVMTLTPVQALALTFDELRHQLYNGDATFALVMLSMAELIAQRASAMTRQISDLYNKMSNEHGSELNSHTKNLVFWSNL